MFDGPREEERNQSPFGVDAGVFAGISDLYKIITGQKKYSHPKKNITYTKTKFRTIFDIVPSFISSFFEITNNFMNIIFGKSEDEKIQGILETTNKAAEDFDRAARSKHPFRNMAAAAFGNYMNAYNQEQEHEEDMFDSPGEFMLHAFKNMFKPQTANVPYTADPVADYNERLAQARERIAERERNSLNL